MRSKNFPEQAMRFQLLNKIIKDVAVENVESPHVDWTLFLSQK